MRSRRAPLAVRPRRAPLAAPAARLRCASWCGSPGPGPGANLGRASRRDRGVDGRPGGARSPPALPPASRGPARSGRASGTRAGATRVPGSARPVPLGTRGRRPGGRPRGRWAAGRLVQPRRRRRERASRSRHRARRGPRRGRPRAERSSVRSGVQAPDSGARPRATSRASTPLPRSSSCRPAGLGPARWSRARQFQVGRPAARAQGAGCPAPASRRRRRAACTSASSRRAATATSRHRNRAMSKSCTCRAEHAGHSIAQRSLRVRVQFLEALDHARRDGGGRARRHHPFLIDFDFKAPGQQEILGRIRVGDGERGEQVVGGDRAQPVGAARPRSTRPGPAAAAAARPAASSRGVQGELQPFAARRAAAEHGERGAEGRAAQPQQRQVARCDGSADRAAGSVPGRACASNASGRRSSWPGAPRPPTPRAAVPPSARASAVRRASR